MCYNFDSKQINHLQVVAMKYKKAISNMVDFQLIGISLLNSLIKLLDNKILRNLIMDLRI